MPHANVQVNLPNSKLEFFFELELGDEFTIFMSLKDRYILILSNAINSNVFGTDMTVMKHLHDLLIILINALVTIKGNGLSD